jgi:Mg-chelatase subunit ChlD
MNIGKLLKKFKKGRGNVALMFGLMALPLTGLIAAGTDLTRANGLQAELQGITDAAVLAAAKSSQTASNELKKTADNVLYAHISSTGLTNVTSTLTDNTGTNGQQLNYSATGKLNTNFLKIFGRSQIVVTATSSAVANSAGAEVVFVLDTTASMSQNNRMTNLKSAVDGVLSSMLNSSGQNVNNIKVGIVPFNVQVKVPPSVNYNWVNWGTAWSYDGCKWDAWVDGMWPGCPVAIHNANTVCFALGNNANRDACKATVKYFDKPVYSSGGKYYYENIVKAYRKVGTKYTIYTHTIKYWWQDGYCAATYSTETGDACSSWVGGGEGLITDSQSTSNNNSNLNNYNSTPSGYRVMPSWLKTEYSFGDGYGGYAARDWDYNWINSSGRNYDMPAYGTQAAAWTGCLSDRDQDFDTNAKVATQSDVKSLYIPRPCWHDPLEPVLPLTLDVASARTKVQSLQPAGYTNITVGIQFGMEILSPEAPYTEGGPWGSSDAAKYMVIITDGYNNSNRFTSDVNEVDKRTAKACEEAKAKKITLFVVKIEEGDSQLLKTCASQPPYFYDLTSSSQLNLALTNMFRSMSKLRLVN